MALYKISKLFNYYTNDIEVRRWVESLSNEDIQNILIKFYSSKVKKKEITDNVNKGQLGENIIERILNNNNIPYIKTSNEQHSGDFICYNKIMLDSKFYKRNVNKIQIDKQLYDMSVRNINFGIIVSFTETTFNVEIKSNIVILYVSVLSEEHIWLYLEIFLNYMNEMPSDSGNIVFLNNDIKKVLEEYDTVIKNLELMRCNLSNILPCTLR